MDAQQFRIESLLAPGGCLPTAEIVELLQTDSNAIKLAKQRNADCFIEGTHFHKGQPGKPNEWTAAGVLALCDLIKTDAVGPVKAALQQAPVSLSAAASTEGVAPAVTIEPSAEDEAYLDFLADSLMAQQYGFNLANRLAAKMAERLPTVQNNATQMGELLGKQMAHLPQVQQQIQQLTEQYLQQNRIPSGVEPLAPAVSEPVTQSQLEAVPA